MCTGGENSLILIKLYIYVQVFYMVRLPSKKKKKKNPDQSTHFFFWHVTGNILILFFWPYYIGYLRYNRNQKLSYGEYGTERYKLKIISFIFRLR